MAYLQIVDEVCRLGHIVSEAKARSRNAKNIDKNPVKKLLG